MSILEPSDGFQKSKWCFTSSIIAVFELTFNDVSAELTIPTEEAKNWKVKDVIEYVNARKQQYQQQQQQQQQQQRTMK